MTDRHRAQRSLWLTPRFLQERTSATAHAHAEVLGRVAHEELLDGAYMTPTYGNTLMGLAASSPSGPEVNYKITYYAPQPRAVIQIVDLDDPDRLVDYGQTGRVKLVTLTKELYTSLVQN